PGRAWERGRRVILPQPFRRNCRSCSAAIRWHSCLCPCIEWLEFHMSRKNLISLIAVGIALASLSRADAQDRLQSLPGYDQYEKMSKLIPTSVKSGAVNVV